MEGRWRFHEELHRSTYARGKERIRSVKCGHTVWRGNDTKSNNGGPTS